MLATVGHTVAPPLFADDINKDMSIKMIVTCESCNTKFRLDPSRLKGEQTKVRCTKCNHVFLVRQPVNSDPKMGLSLGYLDDDEFAGSRGSAAPLPEQPRRNIGLGKVIVGIILLLMAGMGIWWTTSSQPDEQKKSPDPGGPSLSQSVKVDPATAYFVQNSHAGQIFIVEGEVVNESTKPVSFAMVEGRLYKTNQQLAQSQRCYAGNSMTKIELQRMNVTEIQNRMMNREGKNLSNVNIQPSKRVPFMLVFQNLPEIDSLGNYTTELASVKTD